MGPFLCNVWVYLQFLSIGVTLDIAWKNGNPIICFCKSTVDCVGKRRGDKSSQMVNGQHTEC